MFRSKREYSPVLSYGLIISYENMEQVYQKCSAWFVDNWYKITEKTSDSITGEYYFVGDSPDILSLDQRVVFKFTLDESRENFLLSIELFIDNIYLSKADEAKKLWVKKIIDLLDYQGLSKNELMSELLIKKDVTPILSYFRNLIVFGCIPIVFVLISFLYDVSFVLTIVRLVIIYVCFRWILGKLDSFNKYKKIQELLKY